MENVKWLGHAGFYFLDKSGNKIYFVDPFSLPSLSLPKGDLVFITHAHYDHFSPIDLKKILGNETVVIATTDVLAKIQRDEVLKQKVKPNKSYEIKGFKFQTIPAYNNHPERLNFHPKANNWVGYIFHLNEKKVYHAGDTDFIEEMKLLKNENLDVAIIPIGGTYTMDVDEAAGAANAICAKITIPMHYKNLNQGQEKEIEEKFKNLVTNSKVVILEEFK